MILKTFFIANNFAKRTVQYQKIYISVGGSKEVACSALKIEIKRNI